VNRSTFSGIQPVMKSLLLAAGLASGLVVAMVALPVPAVAAEMCQGQTATLVGSPDMSLVGTDGDDVIVTRGSRVVLALGGNDRVCVTGQSGQVYAGFGDDVVDTTRTGSGSSFLGPGADTYLGGPGPDFVKAAGDPGSGAAIGDQEVDVIDVGAGSATIFSGAPGKGNADMITVGDGPSTVNWSGFQTGGAVEFGAGRHRLQVFLKADEPRDWRLGNGLVSDAGDQLVRWTGVVRELSVLAFPDGAALTMLGSAAPELLKARACRVTIEGRGGNDVLRFSLAPDDGCQRQERRLLGGAGADTLLGSPHGDVLLGGGGRDVADGRGGNDRCRAEVRRHCERR
jgi:Ca2+-binding RTX toxin-like protein